MQFLFAYFRGAQLGKQTFAVLDAQVGKQTLNLFACLFAGCTKNTFNQVTSGSRLLKQFKEEAKILPNK